MYVLPSHLSHNCCLKDPWSQRWPQACFLGEQNGSGWHSGYATAARNTCLTVSPNAKPAPTLYKQFLFHCCLRNKGTKVPAMSTDRRITNLVICPLSPEYNVQQREVVCGKMVTADSEDRCRCHPDQLQMAAVLARCSVAIAAHLFKWKAANVYHLLKFLLQKVGSRLCFTSISGSLSGSSYRNFAKSLKHQVECWERGYTCCTLSPHTYKEINCFTIKRRCTHKQNAASFRFLYS